MSLKIYYRKETDGAEILKCFGSDQKADIPGEIGDCKFTAIGSYGFSEGGESLWQKEQFIRNGEQILDSEVFKQELTPLYGNAVTEIQLPDTIQEIRDYAFYRCFGLKRLCLTDQIQRIGGGVFTGCRVSDIEVDFYRGEHSCLKDIVGEVRHVLYVTLRYHKTDTGAAETAKLVFPEYYEEAVENTPARILETHYHGSGCYYRQCFYNREVNFRKYDELFKTAVAQEEEEIVIALASGRLQYPYRLSDAAKEQYETFIRERWTKTGIRFIEKEDWTCLKWLLNENLAKAEQMDELIEYTAMKQKTEILGLLMNEKRIKFGIQKKTFEL